MQEFAKCRMGELRTHRDSPKSLLCQGLQGCGKRDCCQNPDARALCLELDTLKAGDHGRDGGTEGLGSQEED